MAKKRILLGQMVVIDPNDELGIRNKVGHLGIVVERVTPEKSVVVPYYEQDTKMTIMNKFLIPVDRANDDLIVVQRSYPKVHFTIKDIDNIDHLINIADTLDIDDFIKFLFGSTLKIIKSKIQRSLIDIKDLEAFDNFWNNYGRNTVPKEKPDLEEEEVDDDTYEKYKKIASPTNTKLAREDERTYVIEGKKPNAYKDTDKIKMNLTDAVEKVRQKTIEEYFDGDDQTSDVDLNYLVEHMYKYIMNEDTLEDLRRIPIPAIPDVKMTIERGLYYLNTEVLANGIMDMINSSTDRLFNVPILGMIDPIKFDKEYKESGKSIEEFMESYKIDEVLRIVYYGDDYPTRRSIQSLIEIELGTFSHIVKKTHNLSYDLYDRRKDNTACNCLIPIVLFCMGIPLIDDDIN